MARPVARIIGTGALLVGLLGASFACSGSDTGKSTSTTGTAPIETTTLPETPVEEGKQIYTYTPELGDCFDKRKLPATNGTKEQDIILLLECDKPHVNEVFAIVEAPLPDPKIRTYPGDEVVRKFAKTECPKQYDEYVGTPYELSKLEIGYLLPSESSWPGYRKVACYVYAGVDRRVQGTVKGSRR